MRALRYSAFAGPVELVELPDPVAGPGDAVIAVEATGLCRSDVHAWQGHDAGVPLPHVPGHELAGRVAAVGDGVDRAWLGRRVTVPFVCACGRCPDCRAGQGQVCRAQTQPGFTHGGSFAERVLVHDAPVNLVALPDDLGAGAAALLGCRYATAHRALAHVARLAAGESVAVVGCGGVGLSAVQVAVALGADVVAVDVDPAALARASALGAVAAVDATGLAPEEVAEAVRAARPATRDGADGVHVALEATGRAAGVDAALLALARRGRHVQVGLVAAEPVVRLSRVVSHELALLGSHGADARAYPELLALVASGRLRPQDVVARTVDLADVPALMVAMAADAAPAGVTVVTV